VFHWLGIFVIIVMLAFPTTGLTARPSAGETIPHFEPAGQSPSVTVDNLGVDYTFGEELTFNVRIQSTEDIQTVMLFISPAGKDAIYKQVEPDAVGEIHLKVDARELPLRPFTNNRFHLVITLKTGDQITSPAFTFRYEDTRFKWHSVTDSEFEIYWYERDSAFGQTILDVAHEGLKNAQDILPVAAPVPIRIFAYDSSEDLQFALKLNQSWIVGHAAPDLGQMYIYIPKGDDQRLEIERQVPHEIMHFLQYNLAEEDMKKQPTWLMEGMASLAELYPNPEYQRVLEATAQKRQMLSMASLCSTFPREASGAFLAYAQSASFVRFIHQQYGSSGLKNLMQHYNNNLGCEEGVASALGVSLGQVEYRWQQETLGIDTGNLVLVNLSPYLFILLLLAIPFLVAFYPFNRQAKPAIKTQAVQKL